MTTTSLNGEAKPQYDPTKIWTTLLTNRAYFGGLLVLDHSLRKSRSRYQLKVMVTRDVELDEEYMRAFAAAGIPTIVVDKIEPAPRDGKVNKGTWEKLAPWSFTEYEVGRCDLLSRFVGFYVPGCLTVSVGAHSTNTHF